MYNYHESDLNSGRLKKGICRCGSDEKGKVFSLNGLVQGGVILSPPEMEAPLTTPKVKSASDPNPAGAGYGKTFIFAISEKHEIRIARDSDRNEPDAVKHETLFHNADVLAAGEIAIDAGVVTGLNDHSGTYVTHGHLETNPEFLEAVLTAFTQNGVPLDPLLKERLTDLRNQ